MMESLGRAHARAASAPPCDPRGSCESREIYVCIRKTVFVGGQTLLKRKKRESLERVCFDAASCQIHHLDSEEITR